MEPVLLTPSEFAIRGFIETVSLWTVSPLFGTGPVIKAADAIVATNSETPAILATASLYHDASDWVILELTQTSFEELGEPRALPESALTQLLAVRAMCRLLESGVIDERELMDWYLDGRAIPDEELVPQLDSARWIYPGDYWKWPKKPAEDAARVRAAVTAFLAVE